MGAEPCRFYWLLGDDPPLLNTCRSVTGRHRSSCWEGATGGDPFRPLAFSWEARPPPVAPPAPEGRQCQTARSGRKEEGRRDPPVSLPLGSHPQALPVRAPLPTPALPLTAARAPRAISSPAPPAPWPHPRPVDGPAPRARPRRAVPPPAPGDGDGGRRRQRQSPGTPGGGGESARSAE